MGTMSFATSLRNGTYLPGATLSPINSCHLPRSLKRTAQLLARLNRPGATLTASSRKKALANSEDPDETRHDAATKYRQVVTKPNRQGTRLHNLVRVATYYMMQQASRPSPDSLNVAIFQISSFRKSQVFVDVRAHSPSCRSRSFLITLLHKNHSQLLLNERFPVTCKFIPIRTYLSSPAPRSATEYPWPDVHADSGQAVVSSTGCEGVSDLPARTSLMNPMSKPSASGDHGQRDLWSTHQSTHNNSALALNSTCDVSAVR
ncbi:hypothetical protein DPMN_023087 [Dreissena polymorpha]|uniref:Uncharacterized protein n=1 Tax=Dreissena polymorpha TaxID=45954 RepID=A0A9D4LK28_DREPO|nr:hypothetical protein DPMN_023087 [Dreissena polymorpha]